METGNDHALFWVNSGSHERDLTNIVTQLGFSQEDLSQNREVADALDNIDILCAFRRQFAYPTIAQLLPTTITNAHLACEACDSATDQNPDKIECIYLCGNSLGLMPLRTTDFVQRQLTLWAERAVTNWFHGESPWTEIDERLQPQIARLVGAVDPSEVCILNSLTVNINILLSTFYRPTRDRHCIIIEPKSFPSDHYAVQKQIQSHGLDPQQSLLICPANDMLIIMDIDELCRFIQRHGRECAVVWLSGVHYYTGQKLDMERLITCAHEQGCLVGLDLAHAIGNVELKLHEWQCDFAAWCSYKYLNSGPGGVGGIFVHEKHHNEISNASTSGSEPMFEGWWGHTLKRRFEMDGSRRELCRGAQAFRMSCPPAINIAPLAAALEVLDEAGGMKPVLQKQYLLTGYLQVLLHGLLLGKTSKTLKADEKVVKFECITPHDARQRGCQLSLVFNCPSAVIFHQISLRGVVCDERKPNVIRVAPVPLYNSFVDVFKFVNILRIAVKYAETATPEELASLEASAH